MTSHDGDYDSKKEKIEQGIAKCRETISVMEVKLKKVLDRVKSSQASHSPSKKRQSRSGSQSNSNSFTEESKTSAHAVTEENTRSINEVPVEVVTMNFKDPAHSRHQSSRSKKNNQ